MLYEDGSEQLARTLGWFSLALGLAKLATPGAITRLIGVRQDEDSELVVRIIGLREIATGVGILAQPSSPLWPWLRVAGDAMDLALLGTALRSDYAAHDKVAKTMAAVAGVTLVDLVGSQQLSQQADGQRSELGGRLAKRTPSVPHEQGVRVEKSITVNRPPAEVYQFWRDFENLPRFMSHLESVQVLDEQRSHWVAKAPVGMTAEWDAEIIDDTPNERISWHSLEGATAPNAGSVRFKPAPGGRGTMVTVAIEYKPPGGAIGAAIASLFGEEPQQQVTDDLRAFKQVMEIGEVVRSDAVLAGAAGVKQQPAQPPTEKELERAMP
jgi:uncharacterized membrane protein